MLTRNRLLVAATALTVSLGASACLVHHPGYYGGGYGYSHHRPHAHHYRRDVRYDDDHRDRHDDHDRWDRRRHDDRDRDWRRD